MLTHLPWPQTDQLCPSSKHRNEPGSEHWPELPALPEEEEGEPLGADEPVEAAEPVEGPETPWPRVGERVG